MTKIDINVVEDILKSNMALHDFGRPVSKIVSEKLSQLNGPTLFVLNLRGADPLDYEFVYVAFADILQKSQNQSDLFIVFKADKWEAEEVFTGVTKIFKLKKDSNKTDRDILIDNGINLMIINDDDKTIYIASLGENHISVLNEIENNKKITSAEIQQKFRLSVEEISQILQDLLKYKFIYVSAGPIYHPINSLI